MLPGLLASSLGVSKRKRATKAAADAPKAAKPPKKKAKTAETPGGMFNVP
jgi:hypothetical protein